MEYIIFIILSAVFVIAGITHGVLKKQDGKAIVRKVSNTENKIGLTEQKEMTKAEHHSRTGIFEHYSDFSSEQNNKNNNL